MPIGCYAVLEQDQIWLRGMVASVDGKELLFAERRAHRNDAESLGRGLAEELLEAGADRILKGLLDR